LSLSIQITDNIGVPTASIERDIQSKRIANVLEIKYLDESLIPNDPEDDLSMFEGNEIIPFSSLLTDSSNKENDPDSNKLEIIPWTIAGQEKEEEEMNMMDNTMPSLQPVFNNFGAQNGSSVMLDGVNYTYSNPVAMNNNNNNMMGGGNSNNNNMDSNEFINTFINSLPPMLRTLDPFTLQLLIQDPSIVNYLVLADGISVDQNKLMILSNCSTVEEFHSAILPYNPSALSMQQSSSLSSSGGMGGGGMSRSSRWDTPANTMMMNNNNNMNNNNFGFNNNNMNNMNMMNNNNYNNNNYGGQQSTRWDNNMSNNNNMMMDEFSSGPNRNIPQQGGSISARLSNMVMMRNTPGGGNMGGMGGGGQDRDSSKSAVPCRFFNSPKGCMNGEKCKFGHFRDNSSSRGSGPGAMGGGPGSRSGPGMMGPGGRGHHHSHSSSMGAAVLSSFESEKRGPGRPPSKRAKH
jgi:hypothetical protein